MQFSVFTILRTRGALVPLLKGRFFEKLNPILPIENIENIPKKKIFFYRIHNCFESLKYTIGYTEYYLIEFLLFGFISLLSPIGGIQVVHRKLSHFAVN